MTNKELYNSIENPLTRPGFIEELIEIYTEDGPFYQGLVNRDLKRNKQKVTGYFENTTFENQFYTYIFEEWKRAIDIAANYAPTDYPYKQSAVLLNKYLSDKNFDTAYEINQLLDGNLTNNTDVKKALNNLRWDKLGNGIGWEHYDSRQIYAKTHERNDTIHRLYLNCNSNIIYFIALEFMKRCRDRKLKFYYKFDIYGTRDDTIVIYSNDKNLTQYVEILEEIKEEYNIERQFHNPPFLTARINGWIGYGSEPKTTKEKSSYNKLRAEHLSKCIQQEIGSWIYHNPKQKIISQGKTCYYYEYLYNELYEKIKRDCLRKTHYKALYGYTRRDINSIEFKRTIYNAIKNNIIDIIDMFSGNKEFNSISIDFNNQKVLITSSILEEFFKEQVILITTNNQSLKASLLKRIKDSSKEYGISSNYAIDESTQKLFTEHFNIEEAEKKKQYIKRDIH